MKISQFTIATEQDDDRNNFLLYNTHTTAFVVLRKDIYMQIFVNRDFSDTQCCDQLKKMGFLVDDDFDELLALEKLRMLRFSRQPNAMHGATIVLNTESDNIL